MPVAVVDHVRRWGLKISGRSAIPRWLAVGLVQSVQSMAPETTSMRPSERRIIDGYQRPYVIGATLVHAFRAGSKIVALFVPTYPFKCPPTTKMRPSVRGVGSEQKRFGFSW